MGCPKSALLRRPLPNETYEPPEPIEGEGFTLTHRRTEVYTPSGAPMHTLDILGDKGARIGQIHVVLEPDVAKILKVGSVCGFMLDGHEDPHLLARAATKMESFAHDRGIQRIRYVVPSDCRESLAAMDVLGHAREAATLEVDGVEHHVYQVDRT